MLIPSLNKTGTGTVTSLSRRVNANSQQTVGIAARDGKLIKKGEC